jgi:uncharacterized membrane protein YeiB
MIITPYHSQAHIISCKQQQSWLFVSGFGCCILPHHYTTTINHSLTHQQQVLVLGLGFFVCWVFFFCLVLFVITATSKQGSKTNKQASKQTSKQANKSSTAIQLLQVSSHQQSPSLASSSSITFLLFNVLCLTFVRI